MNDGLGLKQLSNEEIMKPILLYLFLALCVAASAKAKQSEIPTLCHADPLYSEYNYGGVWEIDEDGSLSVIIGNSFLKGRTNVQHRL